MITIINEKVFEMYEYFSASGRKESATGKGDRVALRLVVNRFFQTMTGYGKKAFSSKFSFNNHYHSVRFHLLCNQNHSSGYW